jgi:hypothetical protein
VTSTAATLTKPCRQKPRFLPAVGVGSRPNSAESAGPSRAVGDFQPGQNTRRMAVLHGYRHSLWWHTSGPAMLVPYAHNPVYLNVPRVHDRCCGDRVQMGRREWCPPLQRSAPRECSEGGAESTANLFRSEDVGAATVLQGAEVVCSRVSELLGLRTGERAGVHKHGHRQRRCDDSTWCTAGRYRDCDARRTTRSRCAGDRRPVHDLTGRPGHAHNSNGGQGSSGHHGVLVGFRDFLRSTAFRAVTHQSCQTTLTAVRDALRHGSRRPRGRRGS